MRSIPVVVPGIMGSTLTSRSSAGEHPLWSDDFRTNYTTLVKSSGSLSWTGNRAFAKLLNKVTFSAPILPFPLVKFELWTRTLDWIAANPQFDRALLVEYPYDWRAPLEETAAEMAKELAQMVGSTVSLPRPRDQADFVFLMHSMGGLVTQLAIGGWDAASHVDWCARLYRHTPQG